MAPTAYNWLSAPPCIVAAPGLTTGDSQLCLIVHIHNCDFVFVYVVCLRNFRQPFYPLHHLCKCVSSFYHTKVFRPLCTSILESDTPDHDQNESEVVGSINTRSIALTDYRKEPPSRYFEVQQAIVDSHYDMEDDLNINNVDPRHTSMLSSVTNTIMRTYTSPFNVKKNVCSNIQTILTNN